jgi:hypothetical protein
LVVIRPLIAEMLDLRQSLLVRQPEFWPVVQKAAGNGGSQAASEAVVEFNRFDALVRQVQALGAELKDLNTGLLDFPSLRDGREVYLCWRHGEDDIHFWHELDAGFAGRQPL